MKLQLTYSSATGTQAPVSLGEPYKSTIISLPATNISVVGAFDYWTVDVPKPLLINAVLAGANYHPHIQSRDEFVTDVLQFLGAFND